MRRIGSIPKHDDEITVGGIPDLTPLFVRFKELGVDSPPMPDLAQTFEKCEACKGSGREDGDDTLLCQICMGAGQLPDNKLAEWIKTMSNNMDKAYGRS